ncbi:MAG: hypothetical protein M0T73_13305 [Deltaproteobacteria bacterium]|nr:hypothetical protein [Deltaproteobacteria bacterium]
MYFLSKSIHLTSRFWKRFVVFLAGVGPRLIVMVADNDADGFSTYAVAGSKTGFSLLWIFII